MSYEIKFAVKCKTISDAADVVPYANEDYGYDELVNAIIAFLEDESYEYEDDYKIGTYPYDEWDYEGFVDDEVKSGKFLFITIYEEKGKLDWYWNLEKKYSTPEVKVMTYKQFCNKYL